VDDVAESTRDGIKFSDLIILALPVRNIISVLGELSWMEAGECILMDLGSTKKSVIEAMDELPAAIEAIGGHPLCGRETHGFMSASADLYRDQTFVLCRSLRSTPRAERLALEVLKAIGAKPWFLSAERHDSLVAASSHMPYIVAATLVRLAGSRLEKDGQLWRASASGFRDTSRLAGTEVQLMLDILLTNRNEILNIVEMYQRHLGEFKDFLRDENESALVEWLDRARNDYLLYRNAIQDI
jgi:prephenate dehydrogenase